MAARITRFASRADSLRADQAAELRQLVLKFEREAPVAAAALLAAIDRSTATSKGWTFVMLSPAQNRAVVAWLRRKSKRPGVAGELWAVLFERMRMDTGEIIATRAELAREVGCHPNHVSEIMAELVECGALSRRHEGRHVRYFMNPRVATCLTGLAREHAQAEAPRLHLIEVPS